MPFRKPSHTRPSLKCTARKGWWPAGVDSATRWKAEAEVLRVAERRRQVSARPAAADRPTLTASARIADQIACQACGRR